MIDYDSLPNMTPQEAEAKPPLERYTILFRRCYGMRHTVDPYWRNLNRRWAVEYLKKLRELKDHEKGLTVRELQKHRASMINHLSYILAGIDEKTLKWACDMVAKRFDLIIAKL